jgi:RHO1 GDP-GTP exchange protein 1/2
LVNFTDPPIQPGTGILCGLIGGGDSSVDAFEVFPCTLRYNGRLGGLYTIYAETEVSRTTWKQKLEEAIGLHKVAQESNKVFETKILSKDTFFDGGVTCSTPFGEFLSPVFCLCGALDNNCMSIDMPDGRGLIAIGCAEGVWIGLRNDSKCEPFPIPGSFDFG